jgi:hypothetical protein
VSGWHELEDRLDIIEACTRLHWLVDHKLWDQLDEVLAETVSLPTLQEQVHEEVFDPRAFLRSRDDIKREYPALLEGLLTQHLIAGHQVRISGDSAICTAHSINVHVRSRETGQDVVTHGNEYRFDLVRTPKGWRICARRTWLRWSVGPDEIHDVAAKQAEWANSVKVSDEG